MNNDLKDRKHHAGTPLENFREQSGLPNTYDIYNNSYIVSDAKTSTLLEATFDKDVLKNSTI
jgi:hypothetical protein